MKRFVLLTLAALLVAVPATASTFLAMSQAELVRQADAVVIGKVVEQSSSWTQSGRLIYTENLIQVDETVLGDASGTIAVRTFGGQVGDIMVEAHGFPVLEGGESVLLFLRNDQNHGALRVLGYQQGHFRVVTRLDGVTLAVPQVDEGAAFFNRRGQQVAAPESVRLGAFKAQILETAARVGRAVEK